MSPQGWLVVYMTLLAFFTWLGVRLERRFEPFSALHLFNVATALYTVGAAINYYWLGIDITVRGYHTQLHHFGLLPFTVLALIVFNAAYFLVHSRKLARALPAFPSSAKEERVFAGLGLVMAAAAGALVFLGFASFGVGNVVGNPYGTQDFSRQSLIHVSLALDAGLLVAAAYVIRRGRLITPFGLAVGAVLLAYIALTILLGKRAPILTLLLGVALLWHFLRHRFTLGMIAGVALALLALVILVDLGRASPERTPASMAKHIQYMATGHPEFASWKDWPGRILSQGDNLGTLGVIQDNLTDLGGMRMGSTYLEALGKLVPGFLWRGLFSQGLSTLAGQHLSFHFLAEAYLNFGIWGYVIVPAAAGFGIRLLDDWRRSNHDSLMAMALFAVIALDITYIPRLDAGGVLKSFVYHALFVSTIYIGGKSLTAHAPRSAAIGRAQHTALES